MLYRPVRERSVSDLASKARTVISNTGYDELSLVSLSSSDYSGLSELLIQLKNIFSSERISISFPSLRPDSFTLEMAELARGLRQSGLTLAPEAGTQRLRDVINKNITEEDLLQAVGIAFERDWSRIKLYFMIGLPTETEEDLQGMVQLVDKVVEIGRRYGRKNISVSISPFSPKPLTPFQWSPQDTIEVFKEKIAFLQKRMNWREVQLNWRDPCVSRLETVLGRGDRGVGEVIFSAWQAGARFDAWSEQFDYSKWEEQFNRANISMQVYLDEKKIKDPLPWGHLSKGITDSFLSGENVKAESVETSSDCRTEKCQRCGLMSHPVCQKIQTSKDSSSGKQYSAKYGYGRKQRRAESKEMVRKIRLCYVKRREVCFTSHLDTVRIFTRAFRRAEVPLAFSQGYHAHPKIATGPPLPLGFTSQAEYMDIEVLDKLSKGFQADMNFHLPAGFEVLNTKLILKKVVSLNSGINLTTYRLVGRNPMDFEELQTNINSFMAKPSFYILRQRKKDEKRVNIRSFVDNITLNDGVEIVLRIGPEGTAKVEEVIGAIYPKEEPMQSVFQVERTGQFVIQDQKQWTPMEII
jgi:radical SAM-linked protein